MFGLAPTETKSNYDTTFKRVCNSTLTPVNTVPTDSTLLSTIPTAQVSAASTFVIVDVEYVFSPLLPGITFVTGPITFQTSYVWPNYIGANNQVLYLDGAPPNTNYNDGYNCGAIPANT